MGLIGNHQLDATTGKDKNVYYSYFLKLPVRQNFTYKIPLRQVYTIFIIIIITTYGDVVDDDDNDDEDFMKVSRDVHS